MELVKKVREATDKESLKEAKNRLPCIVFAGVIPTGKRTDASINQFSNLAILDYDKLSPTEFADKKRYFVSQSYTVAAFLSPSGTGLKVVIRIKDGSKHRDYYKAILHEFEGLDPTNINPSRVCFESYDPDIYINYQADSYNKMLVETETKVYKAQNVEVSEFDKFKKLATWMQNKNEHFASGSRNIYIHKLAGACCRFGISEHTAKELLRQEYLSTDGDFKVGEMNKAVESAYRRNNFNSAEFDKNDFVDSTTKKTVTIIEDNDFVEDVIYGMDVLSDALKILHYGYESAETTGIQEVDRIFKWKKGELTGLTGIGNHGKSTFWAFLMLNKSALDGTRWALFSPENYPAHEFYHSLTEVVLAGPCNPYASNPPSEELYRYVYDWVAEHFYFVYPKTVAPTPDYIKSRFLELIIKHKVSGCVIDPFNQMVNDYGARDDKYLESFLGDMSRFAMTNNVYMTIITHPHKLKKMESGEYECPDVFDLAGGAMWNNKLDNLLVYYRPVRNADPDNPACELHSKKIRRQSIVGKIGKEEFSYYYSRRQFQFFDFPLRHLLAAYGVERNDI